MVLSAPPSPPPSQKTSATSQLSNFKGRQLSITAEEGTMLLQPVPPERKKKKVLALAGEEDMSAASTPPVTNTNRKNFRVGHASFRLRMLHEQHAVKGKGFEPVEKHKFKGTASLPTSPASGSRLDPMSSLDGKKRKLTNPQSPPGTPTTLGMDRKDSLKQKLSRTHSGKKHSIGGTIIEEGHSSAFEKAMASLRRNNFAHDSFRLRMFKEQYGFEPVFMTKKRNRETANTNLSEFKGCDLNKYTSSTYAIQNGNEVFGGG